MPDRARVETWVSLPIDRPMLLIERQRVIGREMMVSRVVLHKGFVLGTHQHENEQISIVLSGRVRFSWGHEGTADWQEQTLGAGQCLVLPSNVPHAAEALEESVLFDLFAPPSAKTGIDTAPQPGPASH